MLSINKYYHRKSFTFYFCVCQIKKHKQLNKFDFSIEPMKAAIDATGSTILQKKSKKSLAK